MNLFKYILFIGLAAFIFLPAYYIPFLQKPFPALQAKALGGEFAIDQRPAFWPKKWFSGEYQRAYGEFVRSANPVSPFFIRLNTQLEYQLFGDIPHENVLLGSDDYLFTKSDCIATVGLDFVGGAVANEKIRLLHFIKEHYEKKGKKLLILMPPNKPNVLRERLPTCYRNYPADSTNRIAFKAALDKYDMPYIDFDYYKTIQKDSPYPLYPQGGLHWTYYGFALAADTISQYIEQQLDWPLPQMQWKDSVIIRKELHPTDRELFNSANFFKDPELLPMPYPQIRYQEDSSQQKIKVLSVGDSYYKLFHEYGIHDNLFHEKSSFWYYARTLYPAVTKEGKTIYNAEELDALKELEKYDLIILTVYESNLGNFGFGFIERIYGLLMEEAKENSIN